jgi:hypothetical protein
MRMKAFSGLPLAAILLFFASCKKEARTESTNEELATGAVSQKAGGQSSLLTAVHAATSRYHSTTQALKNGYIQDNNCVSVPGLGGMGYHWVNPNLVDPVFDPLQPEVILYASGPNGKLKLVAVEYIVINVGQPAPVFGTQAFMVGGTPVPAPHWSLHVWLFESNPSGMFAPFNPNVSCP